MELVRNPMPLGPTPLRGWQFSESLQHTNLSSSPVGSYRCPKVRMHKKLKHGEPELPLESLSLFIAWSRTLRSQMASSY